MIQIFNKFRYTITDRLGILTVFPLGESDFRIQWDRTTDGQLDYKKTLPSKITFIKAAYQNLLKLERSIYRCEFVNITVERKCGSTWNVWFAGRMSFNEGSWDLDGCKVEIKLDDINDQLCFDNNKSMELNLEQIGPRRTVYLGPSNITIEKRVYTSTTTINGGSCGEYAWGGAGEPFSQGFSVYGYQLTKDPDLGPGAGGGTCEMVTNWAREKVVVACGSPSPGSEWILIADTCPGGSRTYARPVRTYGCVYTLPEMDGSSQITTYLCNIVGDTANPFAIDNGLPLEDVMAFFLSTFCPGYTFVSNFFQINPDVPSLVNYVTGQASKTRFITLFQKSDVKRPSVSGNATKAMLSFENMLKILVEMFNLEWRITGTTLRMEHTSYFSRNAGMDLTSPRYSRFVSGKRQYSYQTDQIPSKETYTFMEAGVGDFRGLPIIYDGGCVSMESRQNIKAHNVENVTTDLELVLSNPDPDSKVVSDDGFVFLACDFDGSIYYVISEAQILGGGTLNNSLAWAQLHRDYHKFKRPLISGIMNDERTTFFSVIPTKKGVQITIPLCCDDTFNPDDTITTPLGVGIVDRANFSFKNETVSLDILYSAEDDLTTNVSPLAVNDTAITNLNTALNINALVNDSDPDVGDSILRVEVVLAPTHGTVTVNPDKTFHYIPTTGYVGDDYFVYRIFDSWNQPSNNALIAITVKPANTAPVAGDDSFFTNQNTALHVPNPSIFANDSDDAGFSITAIQSPTAQGGTVVINGDGSMDYTPPSGFIGTDTFTYTITDGSSLSDTATVTIDVRNPNSPVAANDGSIYTMKNQNLVKPAPGVLANDTTSIGTLAAVAATVATFNGGSAVINSDGSFTYYPPSNFVGTDSFDYTATNGTGTDTATVFIGVLPNIYVKIQRVTFHNNIIRIPCGSPPANQNAGHYQTGLFRLYFYSNSGGTTPFDVTGLNLTVNVRTTGINFDSSTYTSDAAIGPVSGTQFDLFGGTETEFFRDEQDCDGAEVAYFNEDYSLAPGLYSVI